jgi:hypothetical protein
LSIPRDGSPVSTDLQVDDRHDGMNASRATLSIANLPSVGNAGVAQSDCGGADIQFTGAVIDPGQSELRSGQRDLGDNTPPVVGRLSASHGYFRTNIFTVKEVPFAVLHVPG